MDGANELDVADDIEASGYFSLNVLNNGVTARIPNAYTLQDDAAQLPPRCNLFAISNVFGWAVVATQDGFSLINMADLRSLYLSAKQRTTPDVSTARNVQIGPGGLTFLKFAVGDKYVVAAGPALQGGIGIWRLKSLVDGSITSPEYVFPPVSSSALLDVLPNPSDRPELVAVLSQDGQAFMLNLNTKTVTAQFGSNITAACWSVKGKQIVCGDSNGTLTQYTPEGDAKTVTEAAPSLRGRNLTAIDIRWVENTVFFVTYIDPSNPMDTQIFINIRQKSGSVDYAQVLDPLMVEDPDRPEARYNIWLKNWTPFKHLLLVSNTTSNTISHVGQAPVEEGSDNIVWSQVKNDLYTTLPLDTFPLGLDVDLSATEAPSAEENAGEVATPVVWSYATDGTLSAWRVVNKQGGAYAGIAAASDVVSNEEAGSASISAPTPAPTISGMQTPTAGTTPASASPFSTPSAKPSFGAPAFGGGSFSSPPTFGSPAFGRTPSFAPAFGQSSFGSSSTTTSSTPAFGQPAFGKPAFGAPAAAPAGGSLSASTGGFASFSSNKPASGFITPANSVGTMSPAASTSSSPTDAASNAPAKPPAFSFSSFGNSGTPSTSFASLASKTEDADSALAPSPSPTPSADTPKPSPFATSFGSATSSTTSKPAFGSSTAFGSTSAFGSSSSPFGSTSTSKPATPTGSGGFGAFSSSDSSKGFGAFSGKSETGFSFATPQQTPKADPSPAFGGVRDSSTSAFGGLGTTQSSTKPAGLSDTDADTLEPEHVADQKGGALDFSTAKPADALSMTGFGFGSSAKPEESSPKTSPFGSFGKVATTVKQIEERSAVDQLASPPRNPAKRLSFGSPSSKPPTAAESAPSTASAETIKPEDTKAVPAEEKKPAFSFATPSTQNEKPSAFGSSAFGKPSAFGSSPSTAFSLAKPADKPDTSKSAFSAFASSSSSASPFGSPAPASPSTPFGKPGFFSAFGQKSQADEAKAKDSEDSKTALPEVPPQESESTQRASAIEETDPKESHPESKDQSGDNATQEESTGDNQDEQDEVESEGQGEQDNQEGEENEEEQVEDSEDLSDFEHVEGEVEEEASEEGSGSLQETYEEEQEEETQSGEGKDASDEVQEPGSPVSPTPDKPVLPSKAAAEASAPTKSAFGFPVQGSSTTPAFSGFSFNGSEKKAAEAQPSSSSTASAPPSFPGFSKPSEAPQQTNKEPPQPVLNFAAPQPKRPESGKPFGFANLQKAAPRTSSPLASLPSFEPTTGDASASFASQSQATVDESVEVQKPTNFFSLAPPSSSSTRAQSPTSERPPLSQRTSQSDVSQALPSTPPKLSSTPAAMSKPAAPSKGAVNVFNSMQEELVTLKESVAQCLEFFHSVQPARLPVSKTSSAEELLDFDADSWSLGDLPRMKSMIAHLRERLASATAQAVAEEREAKSLEGSLLKTKTKTEEITRYLKAREDPAFARLVKIRQLGPEQLENQKRLRRVQQNVIEGLDQLEQAIAVLKDKMLDRKLGRTPMQTPSLDSIHRASRNIIRALHAKNLELDDLALRLQMATLSTDASGTPKASPAKSSPLKSLKAPASMGNTQASSAVDAKVAKMLAADEARKRLKVAWQEAR